MSVSSRYKSLFSLGIAVLIAAFLWQSGIFRQWEHPGPDTRSTELALAANGAITKLDLEHLRALIPVQQFEIDNPYYEGKAKIYEGFHLRDVAQLLLQEFNIDVDQVRETSRLRFLALDDYEVFLPLELLDDPETIGIVAFRELGRTGDKDWEEFTDKGRLVYPAPYWLVWRFSDPANESRDLAWLVENRPWPFWLHYIELVE